MSKTYLINEIFYSLQGEGMRAGTANVFVRFAKCNLECCVEEGPKSPGGFDCDTEFESGTKMTAKDIEHEANLLWPEGQLWRAIIFTGGEPLLQVDKELLVEFRSCERNWYLALETNGSIALPDMHAFFCFDWITCSPKVAEHAIRLESCDELKYVRGYGQAIPRPRCKTKNKLISPAFDGLDANSRAVDWCIKLVKENPEWRLSPQMHKLWAAR